MKSKKSILEVLVTPIVIAIVGIIGTIMVTQQQIKSSESITSAQLESSTALANAQIQSAQQTAQSNQKIKIIEIFSDKLTSENKEERELAVRMLGTLDPSLSEKLMTAIVSDKYLDSEVKKIANQIKCELLLESFMQQHILSEGKLAIMVYDGYVPFIKDLNNDNFQDLIFCGQQKTFVHFGKPDCEVTKNVRVETDHGHPTRFQGYNPTFVKKDNTWYLRWESNSAAFELKSTTDGVFIGEKKIK